MTGGSLPEGSALRDSGLRLSLDLRSALALLAQLRGRLLPLAAELDVRRVTARQRTREPERGAERVDQREQRGGVLDRIAVRIGDPEIGGAAVAPAVGAARAAVPGAAGRRLEARGDALPVVVAEGGQDRPVDAGLVELAAERVERLAQVGMHAVDGVVAHGAPRALGGRAILP